MGDGPAGVGNSLNNVTTFPAPVVAASTWNTTVQYLFGQALAREHMGKGRNVVLAPTINILRSPQWARAAETLSEDPWLTARMAVAGVAGVQSQGAVACPKHLAAYNQDTNRFGLDPGWAAADARVGARALHELYLPAFRAAVREADAGAVMCSYNRLNGAYACESDWLLNQTLRRAWGFEGFVVADWYFSNRGTVADAMAGLDVSMPGGDLTAEYGFPAFYGAPLVEAVGNGSVPRARLDDMVARVWRYMFKLGQVDDPVTGDAESHVRTQAHLDLAQTMVEDGAVLLKNDNGTLPLSATKYAKIAVFGVGATDQNQVSENHGGFVIDSTMVVAAPLDYLRRRGAEENMTVEYAEAYPGTGQFPTVPPSLFKGGGVNVTYWTTTDFSGPVNQTGFLPNITAATYPAELWQAWPQVWSARYEGVFLPNASGTHHFSLVGQGTALLYLDDALVANMSRANFGNTVQGVAPNLTAGGEVRLRLEYDMGYSLSTGAYGVTLGVDVADPARDAEADALAAAADVSIIFASDRISEGADAGALGLSLPGDQDAVIRRLAGLSRRAVVVLNTNSAVLMPWLDDDGGDGGGVGAVVELWYPGQQVGAALARLLFGDVSPSGKLPVTFPRALGDAIAIGGDVEVPYDEGLYVGYKRHDASGVAPLFPFGHGLTYSEFSLSDMVVTTTIAAAAAAAGASNSSSSSGSSNGTAAVTVSSTLRNTGGVDARQVVQLYVGYPAAAEEPPKLLRAFEKVALAAGESATVVLTVKEEDLRVWNETVEDWSLVGGTYEFMLGFSAGDIILTEAVEL